MEDIADCNQILPIKVNKIGWCSVDANLKIVLKQLDDEYTIYAIESFINSWFILPNDNKKDTLPTKHRLFEPKLLRCITDFLLYKIK